ncbi:MULTISPECIES: UDP-N-acetylmuramoyl-L-alanine--D-glutamate ligase [Enterococcus]|uniref:UDP-N-acetylmuramoylalanine--D-glutamate ligase n=1 Tax=Enterococcus casseliflavus ATCC 12755 TaxID=888066 RepID=F0EP22_ENTCA|nr:MULTISPECIES: UDP-N-acetylmuramoyl-L-alanine--D-glutamate ligase [Enterococcus]AUJ84747.1 UDP-N-acetylmuramoyl-L-alanine--D-glutamate ligase [Enterococcus sp. CR-Ec1]EGC68047.1 UDP-N-acetylmuramoyl-L-alanine--D-glutamate ligase [Enterococcus casseliflavus ATCC 12755]MBE9896130.1 UDP-N-acetylmuramoyl-L-alanine--D-glutamate ligase [Enterococcus casseliflavus]MBF0014522.1 UDP-N-acetylmuramoyl-L-alanine--D-glutamate ligase [Enterococcus casseliflavus]MBO1123321.1 UDP-N-acetylmuramoyl-L-alanine-
MKKITTYQNKKVLVLGLARSGFSAAKLLHDLGALVTVNDGKPFAENPEAQDLLALGVKVITGSHPIELLDEGFSLVVKNPGIPYSQPLVQKALEKKIPVITEVELAYQISEAPIIGITGTNGKTTTTTMIANVLNAGMEKGQALLSGNIGFPASSVAQTAKPEDRLVMELSSFQLMGIDTLRPKIAVITNIYEAHIDYHGSRPEYVLAKWRLQQRMTADDYLVINWNQPELEALSAKSKAKIIPFSTKEKVAGAYMLDGMLYYKEEAIMAAEELGVPGAHNIENALAAIAVGKLCNMPNEAIKQALQTFTGVPHRTQYVTTINQVKFFNDSKATNILATEMALGGFDNEKLVLLAGGLDRGNSFDELVPALKGLKAIVVFGETKEKLASAAQAAGVKTIEMTDNVETAVPVAFSLSAAGDTILLSPANASWDQYPNFEVRGDKFMAAVAELK